MIGTPQLILAGPDPQGAAAARIQPVVVLAIVNCQIGASAEPGRLSMSVQRWP
jgi:hypothetical protein